MSDRKRSDLTDAKTQASSAGIETFVSGMTGFADMAPRYDFIALRRRGGSTARSRSGSLRPPATTTT